MLNAKGAELVSTRGERYQDRDCQLNSLRANWP